MMKYSYLIVSVLLLLTSLSEASGQDFLHGKVLEVDPVELIMTVQADQPEGGEKVIAVYLSQEVLIETGSGEMRLPGCVMQGKHVRVWGKAFAAGRADFQALEVRCCGMASCNDPTGVRARLFRKRSGIKKEGLCRLRNCRELP